MTESSIFVHFTEAVGWLIDEGLSPYKPIEGLKAITGADSVEPVPHGYVLYFTP